MTIPPFHVQNTKFLRPVPYVSKSSFDAKSRRFLEYENGGFCGIMALAEVVTVKIKLTLQEKLKDLRVEKDMTLSDLSVSAIRILPRSLSFTACPPIIFSA
jgi:hypothetical protein